MSVVTELTLLPSDRETALALGSTHFFTGTPCKRGHIAKRNAKSYTCIECTKIACAKYRKTAKSAATLLAHKQSLVESGQWSRYTVNRTLKHTYGITLEEYENLFTKQNGVCAICAAPEKVMDRLAGKIRRLAVDHCHQTNKIRGLLCQSCNTGIGKLQDNPLLMEKAAMYVRSKGELK